jgi:hypothetical protein
MVVLSLPIPFLLVTKQKNAFPPFYPHLDGSPYCEVDHRIKHCRIPGGEVIDASIRRRGRDNGQTALYDGRPGRRGGHPAAAAARHARHQRVRRHLQAVCVQACPRWRYGREGHPARRERATDAHGRRDARQAGHAVELRLEAAQARQGSTARGRSAAGKRSGGYLGLDRRALAHNSGVGPGPHAPTFTRPHSHRATRSSARCAS